MLCPCQSGLEYAQCCAPFHEGSPAPNPLALMRSRYSGYVLRKINYIMGTTHPSQQETHRPFSRWKQEIAQFSDQMSFDGLEILEVEERGDIGFVTFKAHLSQGGKDLSFTEKSRFEKRGDRWFYTGAVSLSSSM